VIEVRQKGPDTTGQGRASGPVRVDLLGPAIRVHPFSRRRQTLYGEPRRPVYHGETAEYGINPITAEGEEDVVMTDNSDRYEIEIPLDTARQEDIESLDGDSDVGPLEPLGEGEEVEITITTDVGAQTVAFLQVPDSLSAQEDGDTVTL